MKLSIIIPVYNEEATIQEIISRIKAVKIQGMKKEIIIVDDGSNDSTPKILTNVSGCKKLVHKQNLGKGAAIKTGLKHATGDIIMIQDADLEYNPEQIPMIISPIMEGKTSVVYGSRFLNRDMHVIGKNKVILPHHFFGNKLLTKLTNVLYRTNITDMETGYKIFSKNILKNININADRFDFEPEITAKIAKKGKLIFELPIEFHPRTPEEGKKISWKDGMYAIYILLKYKLLK